MERFDDARTQEAHNDKIADFKTRGFTVRGYATRSDGYTFYLVMTSNGLRIYAGCRQGVDFKWFRRHTKQYCGRLARRKRKETLMILALLEQQAKRPL